MNEFDLDYKCALCQFDRHEGTCTLCNLCKEVIYLRAEVETARRDAVALDHAYAGALAEIEELQDRMKAIQDIASSPYVLGTVKIRDMAALAAGSNNERDR